MNRSNNDLIIPTRTRSAISVRSGGTTEKASAPYVSIRGSLTLRPPAISSLPEVWHPLSLSAFMDELRVEVNRFPLTLLLHGWDGDLTKEFLQGMFRLLKKEDALWLIPLHHEDRLETPPIKGAVILKPDSAVEQQIDSRIYDNLIAEMAYFPAVEDIESTYLSKVQHRARTIIIDEQGPHKDILLQAAREKMLRSYLWSKGNVLGEGSAFEEVSLESEPGAEQSKPDFEQIGRMLKEMAEYLRNEYDRRFEFRSHIEKVIRKFAAQPQWGEHLVRLADTYQWPSWAVESLPSIYIIRSTTAEEFITAYVWRQIVDNLPENGYEAVRELCQGLFLEIRMPPKTAERAEAIAQIIEEHLRKNPYSSDDAFAGTVEHALFQVAAQFPN
jgi:hypothetical protein